LLLIRFETFLPIRALREGKGSFLNEESGIKNEELEVRS
jgi:hypothetical protein